MGKTTCPDSYRVGPLDADNAAIAQSLLKKAVEYAANRGAVLLDALPELNTEVVGVMEQDAGAGKYDDMALWATNGLPKRPYHKIFGLASVSIV
jgi:hypothetical protein